MRRILRLIFALSCITPQAEAMARSFYTTGAQGVPLAVTDNEAKNGPEILFLHGIGQGKESFLPQLQAASLQAYHMVAFDLRGHGMSGKPWHEGDYTDPTLWAQDVRNVMRATGLKKPVIVAWSYGGLVAADYIRIIGTKNLAGLILVASTGGFIAPPSAPANAPITSTLRRIIALQPIPDIAAQREGINLLAPAITKTDVPSDWRENVITMGLMVPPYITDFLHKHPKSNSDLLPKLNIPMLLVHGAFDPAVSQEAVDGLLRNAACASESRYAAQGHSPFAEARERFNDELAKFVTFANSAARHPTGATVCAGHTPTL